MSGKGNGKGVRKRRRFSLARRVHDIKNLFIFQQYLNIKKIPKWTAVYFLSFLSDIGKEFGKRFKNFAEIRKH